jgi:sortase A
MKVKKVVALCVAVLCILISLGLIMYPVWSSWYLANHQAELEVQYNEELSKKDRSEIIQALEDAKEYNQYILPGTHGGGTFSQEAQLRAAENYKSMLNVNGDGIMGYVEIPKISVSLPILHGTDEATLENGAGHLIGSSLPIGGAGTHSIITAHSGMASQKMFTDLVDLVEGDVFYVKVLGETLAYQVDNITVVLPHEISSLEIYEDKDYVTLVTCTPYAVNTHRLLVRGVRIPYEESEVIVQQTAKEDAPTSTWEKGYFSGILRGLMLTGIASAVIAIVYLVTRVIKKARSKKKNIFVSDEG